MYEHNTIPLFYKPVLNNVYDNGDIKYIFIIKSFIKSLAYINFQENS